jgi:hypothetical protein
VLAALRSVHGEETVNEEVSLYYIANEITTTYHGRHWFSLMGTVLP